jgi:hypothetical protein
VADQRLMQVCSLAESCCRHGELVGDDTLTKLPDKTSGCPGSVPGHRRDVKQRNRWWKVVVDGGEKRAIPSSDGEHAPENDHRGGPDEHHDKARFDEHGPDNGDAEQSAIDAPARSLPPGSPNG